MGVHEERTERDTQVRSFVQKVWNSRNYEAAADLYGENSVNPFGTGPSARVEPIRKYHATFPDLHLDVEELTEAGDTVVLRLTFRETDTGGTWHDPRPGGPWRSGWLTYCTSRVTGSSVNGSVPTSSFIQLGVIDNPWPNRVEEPALVDKYPPISEEDRAAALQTR